MSDKVDSIVWNFKYITLDWTIHTEIYGHDSNENLSKSAMKSMHL